MIEIICHRRNDINSLISTPIKYGVEVDLRTYNSKLIINHDPFEDGVRFKEWINFYNHGTLILNVKEDGLEEQIISLLNKNNISSFFFLDQAFPTIIKMIRNGESRCALRVSEYETIENILKLSNKLDWVWLDMFTKFPITFEEYLSNLKGSRIFDKKYGGTKIGPHKSDLKAIINDDFEASLLSTGQQKTVILMILLSHCNFLVNYKNINPILLFDEIGSHLDSNNRQILLDMINRFKIQFFLTGTDKNLFSFISTNAQFYNITEI